MIYLGEKLVYFVLLLKNKIAIQFIILLNTEYTSELCYCLCFFFTLTATLTLRSMSLCCLSVLSAAI